MRHRRLTNRLVPAAIAAFFELGAASPTAPPTSAPMIACPFFVDAIGANADPKVDGIVVGSNRADSATVRIVVYTHSNSYTIRAEIPGFGDRYNIALTKRGTTTLYPKPGHFSVPLFFAAPPDGPIEAAYAEPFDIQAGSSSCSSQRYFASDDRIKEYAADELKRLSDAHAAPNDVLALSFRENETPPDCAEPYRPARVTKIQQPEYPADAAQTRTAGVSIISVLLGADGSVVDAAVFQSSGSHSLDRASLGAAAYSTYSGTIFRCHPAMGTYLFRSQFTT